MECFINCLHKTFKKSSARFTVFLVLISCFHFGFRFWPRHARLAPIPSAPWISAVNQIGLYAFHAQCTPEKDKNCLIVPFETLRQLLEMESGMNPDRFARVQEIQQAMMSVRAHDVRLKIKFKRVIQRSNPELEIELRTSVKFKGNWTQRFDSRQTKPFLFDVGNKKSEVAMMRRLGYEAYLREDAFQAVRLPYGDGKTAFYLFLPEDARGLDGFLQSLEDDRLQQWFTEFLERQGEIMIPRLNLHAVSDTSRISRILGLSFPSMEGEVRAFFEVKERGGKIFKSERDVEAIVGPEKFQLEANRPFFFAVRDEESGLLLLLGTVRNPVEN